jgi:hypothetical protein
MADDPTKQLPSFEPAPPYGVSTTDKPKPLFLASDEYPVYHKENKNAWLKEDIKRLDDKKVGVDLFAQKEESNTQRFEVIEKKVESLRGCSRREEFEDMKKAIAEWRNFFRSTVAVGVLGGLGLVAGWLWQYYSLTSSVLDASESIGALKVEVKDISKEIQTHKETSLETQLNQKASLEVRFNEMEYRLMLAMSRMSQGQKLKQPSPDAYLRSRKDQLKNDMGTVSDKENDAILKQEVKDITASVPVGTEPSNPTRRNR